MAQVSKYSSKVQIPEEKLHLGTVTQYLFFIASQLCWEAKHWTDEETWSEVCFLDNLLPLINRYVRSSAEISQSVSSFHRFILGGCDLRQHAVCPLTLYQFPCSSCGSLCGWTLHPCFSEMFGLWSVQPTLYWELPRTAVLLQLYSAPQWPPCCVGLCFLIFSVSAYGYRSKPRLLMLCFVLARHCYCSVYLASHLSLVVPFTLMTLHPQLFLSHSQSFQGVLGQVIIWPSRSSRVESCISTPGNTICLAPCKARGHVLSGPTQVTGRKDEVIQ